jgi:hypothetical protein
VRRHRADFTSGTRLAAGPAFAGLALKAWLAAVTLQPGGATLAGGALLAGLAGFTSGPACTWFPVEAVAPVAPVTDTRQHLADDATKELR